ncbi:MAG: O-antigen ligase family protein [Chitinophagaceae bacterium]
MKRRRFLIPGLYLLFITSFFLPFFVALKVIVMGLLVIFVLAGNSLEEKNFLIKKRKFLWFMLAFALAMVASYFISDNHSAGLRFLQLRLPLVLFPLSIGLIQMPKKTRDQILLASAFVVTISCLASLLYAISQYLQKNNVAWLYNDALSYLIGQQSIYTSLLVNIAIYIFAWHLLKVPLTKNYQILLILCIVFLFVISYLLASRNMMLILYSTAIIFIFFQILKKKKYGQGAVALMALLVAGLLIYKIFPKTINRFKELAFTQFNFQSQAKESHYADTLTPDQWNGANFRLAAWQCGWQLFKEHPLSGVGLGDKKDELFNEYKQKQFHFAIATQKNVHNNYLDILYSMGVAGLFLFLTGWIILPLIHFIRTRDILGLLILITFSLAMITENYFDRSIGVMLFSFFVIFLLSVNNNSSSSTG